MVSVFKVSYKCLTAHVETTSVTKVLYQSELFNNISLTNQRVCFLPTGRPTNVFTWPYHWHVSGLPDEPMRSLWVHSWHRLSKRVTSCADVFAPSLRVFPPSVVVCVGATCTYTKYRVTLQRNQTESCHTSKHNINSFGFGSKRRWLAGNSFLIWRSSFSVCPSECFVVVDLYCVEIVGDPDVSAPDYTPQISSDSCATCKSPQTSK